MIFTPLIGHKSAVGLLTSAVERNRLAPAYLFVGPNGVGKSIAVECFIELVFTANRKKKTINPVTIKQRNHPDLLWVEPTYLHQNKLLSTKEAEVAGVKRKTPPQVRLEQIREIGNFLSRPPLEVERSIVVIEQADSMAESPANGLLKTLEEPGKSTIILLAPTVDSLLPTLISRCQRIPFYSLSTDDLSQVLDIHGFSEILENREIIEMSQGSPGKAINSWEQRKRIETLGTGLLQRVINITCLKDALLCGRDVSKLDFDSMNWIIDYLQYYYWNTGGLKSKSVLSALEDTR